MKAVNVYFEDKEIEELEKQKAALSWHDFFMLLADKRKVKKDGTIKG